MTLATNRRMTLEEYLTYADGTDTHYELADGVLIEMGGENPINVQIAVFLLLRLAQLGISHYRLAIGHQIEVASASATARQPDLVVHTEASEAAILRDGKLLRLHMPAPMLVVEVVSNSDTDKQSRSRDYIEKWAEYAARGIPEYWIVDPAAARVTVCTLVHHDYQSAEFRNDEVIASPAFPDLSLTAAQILHAGRS